MPKKPSAIRMDHVLQVRCNDDFLTQIDNWRRQQPDLPSRAEALRRLATLSLKRKDR